MRAGATLVSQGAQLPMQALLSQEAMCFGLGAGRQRGKAQQLSL